MQRHLEALFESGSEEGRTILLEHVKVPMIAGMFYSSILESLEDDESYSVDEGVTERLAARHYDNVLNNSDAVVVNMYNALSRDVKDLIKAKVIFHLVRNLNRLR